MSLEQKLLRIDDVGNFLFELNMTAATRIGGVLKAYGFLQKNIKNPVRIPFLPRPSPECDLQPAQNTDSGFI